jgi:5-methylcytosine-specific restriction endonuclease McrA
MNTYQTSIGERVTKRAIDKKTAATKHDYKVMFIDLKGYLFCERCGINGEGLAASHIVSVKYAQEVGMSELCWDIKNLEILCNKCHMSFEELKNWIRFKWYSSRLEGDDFKEFIDQVK